jgi:lauroyl/myristoyl acyltransferase
MGMSDRGLLKSLHRCRQRITGMVTSGVLAAIHRLGPGGPFTIGRVAGQLAGLAWPMRKRLATNLRHAGVTPTATRINRYFRRFGCWVSWSLAVYHRGFAESGVSERLTFDDSVSHLDQAMARGRGVILVCPHFFCHELGAAAVNRRHPVAIIVRENKNPARDRVKQHWYEATGIETVRRPRRSSLMADTLAYLRVLKSGRALGITPDILVPPDKGVPVQIFGREVFLSPGMAVLAMRSGAPLVPCWYQWHQDASAKRDDRALMCFGEPIQLSASGNRGELAHAAVQDWCRRYEAYLQECPEDWMFWLDKRWTKVLRGRAA